jgi:hypothetical protein
MACRPVQHLTVLLLVVLAACNGDPSPSPAPPTTPPTTPAPVANPCVAATAFDDGAAARDDRDRTGALSPSPPGKGRGGLEADERPVSDVLWNHLLRRQSPIAAAGDVAHPSATADVGHIAVIEDDGTLLLRQNAFDLRQRGLRFEPNGAGYDVVDADTAFRPSLGRRLTLTDDDAAEESLPSAFAFYGRSFSSVFVNSDGNLTFEAADTASTQRGFARLLGGPPRVAPFFSDLDPTTGNGRVFVQAGADAFTVTWCGVRGFEETRTVTAQVSLFPSGVIEMRFGSDSDLGDGIVAVSPGRGAGSFAPVDLSASGRRAGGSGAVGERFAETAELDLVAVARRFYATHRDDFDQLVVFTDTTVVSDAFAFESTVSNAIRGIGQELFDTSRDFGSAGALGSMLVMDRLGKYPDVPSQLVLGESSALAVLAHETGHRWLVKLLFRGDDGAPADLLLGRQRAHWSFFADSDASVMEGNDIEDLRGGAFRTVAAGLRYSRADLYAMGLASAAEVPPFFYVDAPLNVNPARDRESAPRVGVTFNGTRRDVLIEDVVDALGPRQPASTESPRLHRQAYLFVVGRGVNASAADVAKLDRIRREFETFFRQATESRMSVRTTLQ